MRSEIAGRADFSGIRYAQCWEDADVLVRALEPAGKICVSIASAGDNSLSLLAAGAKRVVALDLSQAQLHCLELRVAAYRALSHPELLELLGSSRSDRRLQLYARCRAGMGAGARNFWDARPSDVNAGVGGAGKFERFFGIFRRAVLPVIHGRRTVEELLAGSPDESQRERFYRARWDSRRWRFMFRVFFSRFVMGRLGRDPEFFRYVQGDTAATILGRTRHALTRLNPADNPYLQWILEGRHVRALPHALRPEHFDAIRSGLDRLEWRRQTLEAFLAESGADSVEAFNLSDIFEYMSESSYRALLGTIVRAGSRGCRLAYWNMMVPRRRPQELEDILSPLLDLSTHLFAQDKAFFYQDFVIEETT